MNTLTRSETVARIIVIRYHVLHEINMQLEERGLLSTFMHTFINIHHNTNKTISIIDNCAGIFNHSNLNRIANVHCLPLSNLFVGIGLVRGAEESANVLDNLAVAI